MEHAEDRVRVRRIELDERGAEMGVVTLDRPQTMNPMDGDTVRELGRAFDLLAGDERVRVVAVTGSGPAFSAGGDMKKYQVLQRDAEAFPKFLDDLHRVFSRIPRYPKPYVALVNGIAVAGGLELILSCDLAIASESARIGDAHLRYGQMGGGGVLTRLPRIVGPSRARELIFSGRLLSPREAAEWGLVSQVVEDDRLIETGIAFAAGVAAHSPLAVANAKRVLNTALWNGTGIAAGLELERDTTAHYCLTSDDAREGLVAFAEKRRPCFTGH